MQILTNGDNIEFDNIEYTYQNCNADSWATTRIVKASKIKYKRLLSLCNFPHLFSQFSSLEALFSPKVAPADAWTFIMWLAIICSCYKATAISKE